MMTATPTVKVVSESCPVVVLEYDDLIANADLSEHIAQAFGPSGLGVLAVKGVPGFAEKRKAILPLSWRFGQLPNDVKSKYEVPPYYHRGWDCGHEQMRDGTPDTHKGSYYINPVRDSFPDVDPATLAEYPTFFDANIFPQEIPEFERAIKDASALMIDVGALVARQCDGYAAKAAPGYPASRCEDIVRTSQHHACRLLHYFALQPGQKLPEDIDSWCGFHNDHCSLTALMPAMYHDDSGNTIACPDKAAGLYIKARSGELVHVRGVPEDYLLLQIGETAQIHSGGALMATPHAVRGCSVPGVSRSTMAVFLQPSHAYDMEMPRNSTCTVEKATHSPHLPPTVPALGTRWQNEAGDTFGLFSKRTIHAYYSHNQPSVSA